jgi:small subunit ribosomal protein S7
MAFRWLAAAASARKGVPMTEALAAEVIDAYNNTGTVVKKREETHKMAQANRAFAHLRW